MKDLYSVASDFVDRRLICESDEEYDGGNEFNHLEQAIFASEELENSIQSLKDLNPGKYSKYMNLLKKIKQLSGEFRPMLDSLKSGMEDGNSEGDKFWEQEEGDEEGEDFGGSEFDGGEGEEEDDGDEDDAPFDESPEFDDSDIPWHGDDEEGND